MMVYNADVRRNTRQFKKLAVMSEANAPTMTAAANEEAQALQSDFFQSIPKYRTFREEVSHINAPEKEGEDDTCSSMLQLTLSPELPPI